MFVYVGNEIKGSRAPNILNVFQRPCPAIGLHTRLLHDTTRSVIWSLPKAVCAAGMKTDTDA